jgi:hypothetical protein
MKANMAEKFKIVSKLGIRAMTGGTGSITGG